MDQPCPISIILSWRNTWENNLKGNAGCDVKTMVRCLKLELFWWLTVQFLFFPATFVGNPHIVAATKRDYAIPVPQAQATFPEPLPAYLPRTVTLPAAEAPPTNMASADAGRFSVSLRGMRRDLRRAGGRAERLVTDIETTLVEWLLQGGTVLRPNSNGVGDDLHSIGKPIGNSGKIVEVSRTPLQLIWRISDDPFARYVVHCCARYHEVVSFSEFFPAPLSLQLFRSWTLLSKVKEQTKAALHIFYAQMLRVQIVGLKPRWRLHPWQTSIIHRIQIPTSTLTSCPTKS